MKTVQHTPNAYASQWAKQAQIWLKVCACALAVWGGMPVHAQNGNFSGRIEALADSYNLGASVAAGQSRVIFYRPQNAPTRGAISVLVNEQYHASLIAGGYSFICLTPGQVELGVRQMDVELRPNKDGLDAISAIDLKSGQTYYMKVDEQQGRRIFLRPVAVSLALQELASTRLQVHTVSRVKPVQECRTVDAPQVTAVTPQGPAYSAAPAYVSPPAAGQSYQLAGDTLFAFNRSDRGGLTQDGVMAIQRLLNQIRMEYSRIDRIHVIGHADPLGNDYSNERLSIERAQTVRDYIEVAGQLNGRVSTEGRGSREPVVRHCSRITSPESMACNQPNRRVAVEVTGQRR
jgi:OOP family OmpA-OmpF porin